MQWHFSKCLDFKDSISEIHHVENIIDRDQHGVYQAAISFIICHTIIGPGM